MRDIKECIVYEDDDICVCHKSSGVLTQSDRGFSQDMVSVLMTYERKKGNRAPFIAPVNRLDRPVEGLVLYAKNSKAAAALTRQITQGEVDKCYYAVVKVTDRKGMENVQKVLGDRTVITLENYLLKDSRTNMSRVVPEGTDGAKKAVLEYQVLGVEAGEELALLRVKLHTGRHHQIRVQLSEAGMPILNDTKYGVTPDEENIKDTSRAVRDEALALCSYRLVFSHPVTRKKLIFEVIPKGKSFALFSEDLYKRDNI